MSNHILKAFEAAFGVWTTTGYFKHKPTQHQLDGFRKGYAIAEQASADRIAQLEKALVAQNHIPDAGKMVSEHSDDIAVDRFAEAMKTKLEYCLGYTHEKCDSCIHLKTWHALNNIPDSQRLKMQDRMDRINSDKCRMTNMGEYLPAPAGVEDAK